MRMPTRWSSSEVIVPIICASLGTVPSAPRQAQSSVHPSGWSSKFFCTKILPRLFELGTFHPLQFFCTITVGEVSTFVQGRPANTATLTQSIRRAVPATGTDYHHSCERVIRKKESIRNPAGIKRLVRESSSHLLIHSTSSSFGRFRIWASCPNLSRDWRSTVSKGMQSASTCFPFDNRRTVRITRQRPRSRSSTTTLSKQLFLANRRTSSLYRYSLTHFL